MKSRIQFEDADLKALIESALKKDCAIQIQAKGNSMAPSINHNDLVTIYPYGTKMPDVGDIAAFILPEQNNKLLIHRIIKNGEQFLLKGDNLKKADGFVERANILGIVKKNTKRYIAAKQRQRIMAWLSQYNMIVIFNKIRVRFGMSFALIKSRYIDIFTHNMR